VTDKNCEEPSAAAELLRPICKWYAEFEMIAIQLMPKQKCHKKFKNAINPSFQNFSSDLLYLFFWHPTLTLSSQPETKA
jgi:hypothetical protein